MYCFGSFLIDPHNPHFNLQTTSSQFPQHFHSPGYASFIYDFEIYSSYLVISKVRDPHPLLHQKVYKNFFSLTYTFLCRWTSIKGFIVTCFSFAVLFSLSSRQLICEITLFSWGAYHLHHPSGWKFEV